MAVQTIETIRVPVCLDTNQQVIAMFTINRAYEPEFGALCRELGGLPTLEEAEAWLKTLEERKEV
ncbi:hypothetical protein HUW51_13895 [Adhaeribacter swui]|uniref:Uncharacterized protein n=1 Tax=Adhaeribacter swui TaxID=2086471 RepID=A0A7G7G9C4_9BACT|nr:hypothetical protein [Adhaeribacter swui]QNF33758.1 hypothetical protein HUW51_13895 [Adhaeribacter swui]